MSLTQGLFTKPHNSHLIINKKIKNLDIAIEHSNKKITLSKWLAGLKIISESASLSSFQLRTDLCSRLENMAKNKHRVKEDFLCEI